MSRRWSILAALTAALVLVSMIGTIRVAADAPDYLYIDGDEASPKAQKFLKREGVHYRHGFKGRFSVKVDGNAKGRAKKELKDLGFGVSDIAVYQPNGTPSDPTPYGIEQIYADNAITKTFGGKGITIGHLDTGIDVNHPDLAGRVVGCKDATGSLTLDDKKNKTCKDLDGHGTHTAGSAVADGGKTGTGIWGVAPEAKLYSIVVCTSAGCFADDIAAAIDYLGTNGLVDVITMSIGGPASDPTIAAAIAKHKDSILFVASAGNRGPSPGSIEYPAWDPNVIAVTAIDDSEKVTNFSSRGKDDGDDSVITIGEIEFAAAGSMVESTFPTYFTEVDGYEYFSGTSMAAPQVAGLAAKLWQGDPNSTRLYLRTNATDIVDGIRAEAGYDVASGYGLPHVAAVAPPPPPPPPAELDSVHVGDIDGDSKKRKRGKWQANVTVVIHEFDEGKVRLAEVEATWSTSKGTTTAKCRVKRGSSCKFRSPSFGKGVSYVTFEVTDISHKSLTYSAGDNHDPDRDSDGTTLVIHKP